MSKDIPEADIYEWCERRNYALVAREDFPYLFKDVVKCGECKWCDDKGKGRALICTNPYIDMDIHPLAFCSYGEREGE